jgi:hypothetical protein
MTRWSDYDAHKNGWSMSKDRFSFSGMGYGKVNFWLFFGGRGFIERLLAKSAFLESQRYLVTTLLPLGCLALGLLVFLHLLLLFLGSFALGLLVLLGRSLSLAAVFSDTPVFWLSARRY